MTAATRSNGGTKTADVEFIDLPPSVLGILAQIVAQSDTARVAWAAYLAGAGMEGYPVGGFQITGARLLRAQADVRGGV